MQAYKIRADVLAAWKSLSGRNDASLAHEMGVSAMALSRWIRGERSISLGAARELERITGIPLERLVTERASQPTARTAEQVIEHAQLPGAQPQSGVA